MYISDGRGYNSCSISPFGWMKKVIIMGLMAVSFLNGPESKRKTTHYNFLIGKIMNAQKKYNKF